MDHADSNQVTPRRRTACLAAPTGFEPVPPPRDVTGARRVLAGHAANLNRLRRRRATPVPLRQPRGRAAVPPCSERPSLSKGCDDEHRGRRHWSSPGHEGAWPGWACFEDEELPKAQRSRPVPRRKWLIEPQRRGARCRPHRLDDVTAPQCRTHEIPAPGARPTGQQVKWAAGPAGAHSPQPCSHHLRVRTFHSSGAHSPTTHGYPWSQVATFPSRNPR